MDLISSSYSSDSTQKPDAGAFANPDCEGPIDRLELALLINEGAGGMVHDYSPRRLRQILEVAAITPAVTPGPGWGVGPDGLVLDWATGAVAQELTYFREGPNRFGNTNVPYSFVTNVYPTSDASAFLCIGERTDSNANILIFLNGGPLSIGGGSATPAGPTPTLNAWSWLGVSQSSATARNFFLNRAVTANTTNVGSNTIGADQPITLGASYVNGAEQSGNRQQGKQRVLYLWSRGISIAEYNYVLDNPYWFMKWARDMNNLAVAASGAIGNLWPMLLGGVY